MRIGAVSYLNTKPLVEGLAEHAVGHELVFDLPSRLADGLASGKLDVALIPSIEFFQNPDYRIISDACIGCRGEVWAVKLLSRVPLEQIRTLALDEGSRTSAALARFLLQERLGLKPKLVPFPIDLPIEQVEADAVVVIGDRAMHPLPGNWLVQWDLGDQWCRHYELSFVFAMWVARPGIDTEELEVQLAQARDRGLENVRAIAARRSPQAWADNAAVLGLLPAKSVFLLGPSRAKRFEAVL
ncbi:MAG: menaquinone biosynthesis protein [Pirellulales bacterium]